MRQPRTCCIVRVSSIWHLRNSIFRQERVCQEASPAVTGLTTGPKCSPQQSQIPQLVSFALTYLRPSALLQRHPNNRYAGVTTYTHRSSWLYHTFAVCHTHKLMLICYSNLRSPSAADSTSHPESSPCTAVHVIASTTFPAHPENSRNSPNGSRLSNPCIMPLT